MNKYIIFVILLTTQFGWNIQNVVSQGTKIYPVTVDTFVIPPRDMSLGCESNGIENVSWVVPNNAEFWTNSNFGRRVLNINGTEETLPKYLTRPQDKINITYMNVTDETGTIQIKPAALLILKNFTYHDIGNYYCHIVGTPFDDEENSKKIFVFVKDDKRLSFLEQNKTYIMYERNDTKKNVTFPCIPTARNTTVLLKGSSSTSNYKEYLEVSSEIASFNSRIGYTLKLMDAKYDKFICEFINDKIIEQVFFTVQSANFFEYNVKPFINYTSNYIQGTSGEDLTLSCTIATDSDNTSTVIWVVPNKSHVNIEITNVTIPLHNGQLHASTLNIKDLSANDAGEYICRLNDTTIDSLVRKYVYIDSIPLNPKINASKVYQIKSGQNLILSCKGGKNLKWTVPIYKNELTDINNTEVNIRNGTKNNEIIFYIMKVLYYNTGYYYCHESNTAKDDPNFSSKIFLYVEDDEHLSSSPSVIKVKTPQYSNATIPCIPTSSDVNVTLIDISTMQELPEKYIFYEGFELYFPIDDIIVNLACKFTKNNKSQIQKIIIDVEKTYKYEYLPFISTPDNVYSFIGGDLFLTCAVIVVSNFSPKLIWDSPGLPDFLANKTLSRIDSSYFISNGKLAFSTIVIKNVKLGDYIEFECAFLDESNKTHSIRKVVSLNIIFDIKPYIETSRLLATGETMIANCTVRADHNIRFNMTWQNPTNMTDSRMTVTDTIYDLDVYGRIGNNSLVIKNITINDAGNYTCHVKDHLNNTNEDIVVIEVKEATYPKFDEIILIKNVTIKRKAGEPIEMKCAIDETDVPKPILRWYKDYQPLNVSGRQEFLKPFLAGNDSGFYSCNVSNYLGMTSSWLYLEVETQSDTVPKIFVFLVFALIISFIMLIFVFSGRLYRERKFQRLVRSSGLDNLEEGEVRKLDPDICISDQADLLPYDKKWEVPRDRVKIGKQLGSGQFGVVMKGEVLGVFVGETIKTVAIKMVHKNANYLCIKLLVNELRIMTYIGKHVNVVNLLGACTRNIIKRELLILTEFCPHGNLRDYLLAHRELFINQIDPETGVVDIDNINLSMYKKNIPSEDELSKQMTPYVNLEDKGAKHRKFNEADYRTKEKELCNEKQDFEIEEKPKQISTNDLLCWSFQAARAMDYLSSRKILHGDLAARNVLLSDNNIIKICDFGLAKNIYRNKHYKKKTKTPLPVKWMAIESIRDRIFSAQSDVWSFGVVLWELFSLGRTPYPELEADAQFVVELENGVRMEQPEFATSEIYQIMTGCWKCDPSERLTFPKLVKLLESMVHENVRTHYIELNKPYENLNISEGAPNYLTLEDSTSKEKTAETEIIVVKTEKENDEDQNSKEKEIIVNENSQIRQRIKSNADVEIHHSAE